MTPEQQARLDRILGPEPRAWDAPSADATEWTLVPDEIGPGATLTDAQGHEVATFRYIRDARTVMQALEAQRDR